MIGQENLFALTLSKSLHPRTIIRNGRRADPMNLLSHTQKFKLAPTFCVISILEVEKVLFTSQCNAQRYQKTKIQNLVFYQRSSLFCTLIVFRSSIIKKPIHHHCFIEKKTKASTPKILKPTLHSLGCFCLGTLALTTGSLRPKIGRYIVSATSIHSILTLSHRIPHSYRVYDTFRTLVQILRVPA